MLVTSHFRQHLFHAPRQFIRIRQTKRKRHRFARDLRRQVKRWRRDYDRPPRAPKRVRQITQPPADLVVVAIPREILQQEYRVSPNLRDIRERLLRLRGSVNRRAFNSREARRHAPRVQRNAQLHGNRRQQVHQPLLFRRLHDDNGISRIDQQPQFVALAANRRRPARTRNHRDPVSEYQGCHPQRARFSRRVASLLTSARNVAW